MRLSSSWWLMASTACLLVPFVSCENSDEQLSFLARLTEIVSGKTTAATLDVPDCLIELGGGIEGVERSLEGGLKSGYNWAILITSAHDKTAFHASEIFFEAVQTACQESPSATSDGASAAPIVEADFRGWSFAHMSFDDEPDLIWRWWIWKVPVILFVSSPTQEKMPYDARFWKVAFGMPSSERLLETIKTGAWKRLPVWNSDLAPGGKLELIPAMLGRFFGHIYQVLDPIPSWLLTIFATTGGSLLIAFLHSSKGDTSPKAH